MKQIQLVIIILAAIIISAFPVKAESEFDGLSFDKIAQILDSRREEAKMGGPSYKISAFVIYDTQSLYISQHDWDQLPNGFKERCKVVGIALGYEKYRTLVMICDTREYTFQEAKEKFGYKLPSLRMLEEVKNSMFYLKLWEQRDGDRVYYTDSGYGFKGELFEISKAVMEPFLLDMYCWTSESVADDPNEAFAFNTHFRRENKVAFQKRPIYDRLRVIPMISLWE